MSEDKIGDRMKVDLEKLKYHLSLVIDHGGDPVYTQLRDIVEELQAGRELRYELGHIKDEEICISEIYGQDVEYMCNRYDRKTGSIGEH